MDGTLSFTTVSVLVILYFLVPDKNFQLFLISSFNIVLFAIGYLRFSFINEMVSLVLFEFYFYFYLDLL